LEEVEVVGALRKKVWVGSSTNGSAIWNKILNIKSAISAKFWWEVHHISIRIDLLEDLKWYRERSVGTDLLFLFFGQLISATLTNDFSNIFLQA